MIDVSKPEMSGEGFCTSCKRYGILEPVTYLDDDLIRTEGMFCHVCKSKAQVAGVLR